MLPHNSEDVQNTKEQGYRCFNALCDVLERYLDVEMYSMVKDMAYQCLCVSNNFEGLNDLVELVKDNIPSSKFKVIEPCFVSLMETNIILEKTLPSIVKRWKDRLFTYEDALYLLKHGHVSMDVVDVVFGERDVEKRLEAIDAYIRYHKDEELRKNLTEMVGDQFIWQIRETEGAKRDYWSKVPEESNKDETRPVKRTDMPRLSDDVDGGDGEYIHRRIHDMVGRYKAYVKMARIIATNIIEYPEDIGDRWLLLKSIIEESGYNNQVLLMEKRILKDPTFFESLWVDTPMHYDPDDLPEFTKFGLHDYIRLLKD